MSYWKKEDRLKTVEKIMLKVDSYDKAVLILNKKHNIKTDRHTLSVICRAKKIPRPLISLNHGGDRRSKKFEEMDYEYAV
jgi:hypothetical protein